MNKCVSFSGQLLEWYAISKRDLPWRRTRDPYKIWISEIMLQQTTVATVIPYFERWVVQYPTMDKLAAASEQSVMLAWQGLGYYSRVRNIHKAAKIMVRDFDGLVPDDPETLRKLPGFGPYTVGAVLSIAYGKREPIIDANVRRIVMRLNCFHGKADASVDTRILPWIEKNLPHGQMSEFNQAFMELGALVCAKQPQCLQCPVSMFCTAHAKGVQDQIPEPKKIAYVDVDMVAVVIRQGDKYYIQQRSGRGVLAGLWEFPCRRTSGAEAGSRTAEMVVEELCQRSPVKLRKLDQIRHYYTNHRVRLHAHQFDFEGELPEDATHQWTSLAEIKKYPMHSGSLKIVEKLI